MSDFSPSPSLEDRLKAALAHLPSLDERLRMTLDEDLRGGDITGEAIFGGPGDPVIRAAIICKKAGVAAGLDVAARVFELMDPDLDIEIYGDDGDSVEPGEEVLIISGSAYSVLGAERTALNLLQRLSGVATLTRAFVERVGDRARVLDTRKTTPLWRDLEKAAVAAGGGVNHRMGLFHAYMIKDNHVDAAGGVVPALKAVAQHREKSGQKDREVVLEVRNLAELQQAIDCPARPDVVMLDNMGGATMREAVGMLQKTGGALKSEVSGGIRLETVEGVRRRGGGPDFRGGSDAQRPGARFFSPDPPGIRAAPRRSDAPKQIAFRRRRPCRVLAGLGERPPAGCPDWHFCPWWRPKPSRPNREFAR
jgi:nicotinate-nucleotide pyrophosphorylase (carboxylating)